MVITDELSNDTMLIQLRCKTNRRVKDRHAFKQKKSKKQKKIFICGNHNILILNISQENKNKITYGKYKINSNLKLQG